MSILSNQKFVVGLDKLHPDVPEEVLKYDGDRDILRKDSASGNVWRVRNECENDKVIKRWNGKSICERVRDAVGVFDSHPAIKAVCAPYEYTVPVEVEVMWGIIPFIKGEKCFINSELNNGIGFYEQVKKIREKIFASLSALETLFAEGVSHADLKPDHIIQTDDGSIILIDNDLLHDEELIRSKTGIESSIGTPAYMAPEVMCGVGYIGPTYNHYQLAQIVYEALGGAVIGNKYVEKDSVIAMYEYKLKDGKYFEEVKTFLEGLNLRGMSQVGGRLHELVALSNWVRAAMDPLVFKRPQSPKEHIQLLNDKPNFTEY